MDEKSFLAKLARLHSGMIIIEGDRGNGSHPIDTYFHRRFLRRSSLKAGSKDGPELDIGKIGGYGGITSVYQYTPTLLK